MKRCGLACPWESGRGPRSTLRAAIVLLVALVPVRGHAQTIVGKLLDGETRRSVVSGLVILTGLSGELVDAAVTDVSGRFQLSAPVAGDYLIVVRADGYAPTSDGILQLADGGYIEISFYVRPAPIELPGITVSVERTYRHLTNQGFYERRQTGFGYFLGPEELERLNPSDTRDLLRAIPGLWIKDYGYAGQSARCSQRRRVTENPMFPGRHDGPDVWVDGVRLHFQDLPQTDGPDVDIGRVVGTDNIAAVEFYPRTAHVPLEYGGLGGTCVILIWTKR